MIQTHGKLLLSLIALLSFGVGLQATHQWGSYQQADTTVKYYFSAGGGWAHYYEDEAIDDTDSWHTASVMDFDPILAYKGCLTEAGGFSGWYGTTGWLGLTTLDCLSGSTILSAFMQLNRSYLDSAPYTDADIRWVACHELGHTFGLDHHSDSNSCIEPSLGNGAAHPSSHDIAMLDSMY